jgi:dienelactone hydrolase
LVLALPGGEESSLRPRSRTAEVFLWPVIRAIAQRGRARGVVAHVVRYRHRGWNGEQADPVTDARRAIEEVRRRYGPLPVGLVGHSLGGRVAVHVAGESGVEAVALLAPWLEDVDPVGASSGRRLLVVHGARDRHTDPEASYRFAVAARRAGARIQRVQLPGGHLLMRHRRAWTALTAAFLVDTLSGHVRGPEREPGLRIPL